MTPAEVLARHTVHKGTTMEPVPGDLTKARPVEWCNECARLGAFGVHWPCDAVDQARQLQEAQERAERLQDIFRREASASLVELAASEERVAALEEALRTLTESVLDRPFADPDDDAAKAARAAQRLFAQPAGELPTGAKAK